MTIARAAAARFQAAPGREDERDHNKSFPTRARRHRRHRSTTRSHASHGGSRAGDGARAVNTLIASRRCATRKIGDRPASAARLGDVLTRPPQEVANSSSPAAPHVRESAIRAPTNPTSPVSATATPRHPPHPFVAPSRARSPRPRRAPRPPRPPRSALRSAAAEPRASRRRDSAGSAAVRRPRLPRRTRRRVSAPRRARAA